MIITFPTSGSSNFVECSPTISYLILRNILIMSSFNFNRSKCRLTLPSSSKFFNCQHCFGHPEWTTNDVGTNHEHICSFATRSTSSERATYLDSVQCFRGPPTNFFRFYFISYFSCVCICIYWKKIFSKMEMINTSTLKNIISIFQTWSWVLAWPLRHLSLTCKPVMPTVLIHLQQ